MAETPEFWSHTFGSGRGKVTVYEEVKRKRVLYLKWRAKGGASSATNWRYESLAEAAAEAGFATATLFDEHGEALKPRELKKKTDWAKERAEAKFAALKAGTATPSARAKAPLTLGKAWAIVGDPKTGKHRGNTPHDKETKREFEHVVRILGEDTTFEAIRHRDLAYLWRTRIKELRGQGDEGHRGSVITVARLLAVANWLRDHEDIAKDACIAPSSWKVDLLKDWKEAAETDDDYKPTQLRYSLDEMRRLFVASQKVDPRLDLLIALGAELRPGQVRRAMRSSLQAETKIVDEKEVQIWRFRAPGAGKKKSRSIQLTPGQVDAVARAFNGYLRLLEAAYRAGEIKDYRLFFAGTMKGNRPDLIKLREDGRGTCNKTKFVTPTAEVRRHAEAQPVSMTAVRKWWAKAEKLANPKIDHIDGRGPYGLRRQAVDAAKELKASREALQNLGGWSDTQVPDSIYAEQEQEYAQAAAAELRAKIRGETP